MRSDSQKREEASTFPAIRRPPGGTPRITNRYESWDDLKSLVSVPEKKEEDGKDSLRACAVYRKNVPRVSSATDGSLISV